MVGQAIRLPSPACGHNFSRLLTVAAPIRAARVSKRSLTFFDEHEGNVIGLGHALSEFLNGFQELLLERRWSGPHF
jgi:hypothetical protein